MPLHEADALFARLDAAYPAEAGYDKTAFRIDCIFQGEPDSYEGRQDFGDRDGSLIEHIQSYHQFYAQDENWKKHVIATTGIEGWEQDKAHRDMLLGRVCPLYEAALQPCPNGTDGAGPLTVRGNPDAGGNGLFGGASLLCAGVPPHAQSGPVSVAGAAETG